MLICNSLLTLNSFKKQVRSKSPKKRSSPRTKSSNSNWLKRMILVNKTA